VETLAIISDIHANAIALDGVRREIDRLRPDHVVCLGDVAATGPAPCEVIASLRDTDWSFVRGNCDDNILSYAAGDDRPVVDAHDEIDRWCAQQLSPEELSFIAAFKPFITLASGGVELCFYHGSPRSNLDEIMPDTSDNQLEGWFDGHRAVVFGGGHTHVQMVRRFRASYVLNPGSVGLPFTYLADGRIFRPSWAEFGIVRIDGANIAVELCRVTVDMDEVMTGASQSGMPGFDWWSGSLE
jgi:predicted phosphodiesterase